MITIMALKFILRIHRLFSVTVLLAYGLLLAAFLPWLLIRQKRRVIQHWCELILRVLQVRICVRGNLKALEAGLVLPNHVSWLDIIVLNALLPARFIAKDEVKRWVVIGWLAERVGTLFLRRHASIEVRQLKARIEDLITRGEHIVLFAEGTTTTGETVLPFHSGLLQAAVQTRSHVYPTAIRYHTATGELDPTPAYVDECSLIGSLWKVTGQRHTHVVVAFGQVVTSDSLCRRLMALQARQEVAKLLQHIAHTNRYAC